MVFILLFRWAKLVTTLLEFWTRLSVVAEQLYQSVDSLETAGPDGDHSNSSHSLTGQDSFALAEAGQGVACRIMEVQQEDDVLFGGDLNFLVFNDTEIVERVQVWLTRLMDTQVPLMAKYSNQLLDKVQGVSVRQLEMGEAVLKGVTMKLLADLHRLGGPGTLEMWGEESMWMAGVVELLFNSEELDRRERDLLEESWTVLVRSILTHVDREQEMVVLSSHFLPVWQEMLKTGKVDKFGPQMGQVLSSVVSRALAEQKVIEDLDISELVRKVMDMLEPDLNVVAMLAWSEVMEASVMDVVGGQEEARGVVMRGKMGLG